MGAFFNGDLRSVFASLVHLIGAAPILENDSSAVAAEHGTIARCNGRGEARTAPTTFAKSRTYASVAGGADILAIAGIPCCAIRCGGAGTLAVCYVDGSIDTITIAANETINVRAIGIVAGSTATAVTIFWDA